MENIESLDYHEDLQERQIGAKVLSSANFHESNKEIVESSFNKAIKRGEKLPGKNAERRNIAYLDRLQNLVDKYGNSFEKMVWGRTIESLVIKPEAIAENYWKTQEQILRDNGQGRTLTDREKELLTEDIQKHQRESLETWTNYLSHEDCPYPTWFKVYIINGISKMGTFDKSKNAFKKRDESSVAPYPHLNQATLAKVYDAITDFYGIDTNKDLAGVDSESANELEPKRNTELDALVQSGNFNKLYSRMLLSEKTIMKTPEHTEDIDGEWVEYGLGDEEAIADAADGTPWCVASSSVGRSYLSTGYYGNSYDEDYEDENNKAKFIFFHLRDEDGRLADNACASIRLDTDGNVAEISGLKDGQALEDSLVPIVQEKVRSLPGGEKFLRRFADKNALINLDSKIKRGEDITSDEFRFIWEMDRPIETLDTYNNYDPRIEEFRKKFNSEYAAEKGYITRDTKLEEVEVNLERYLLNDLGLKSNLLVYALKNHPDIWENSRIKEITKDLGQDFWRRTMERIRSLEIYETKNYLFMLPKDRWDNNRIELPENPEYEALAPSDFTAILKAPVDYDWNYETDGRDDGSPTLVYDGKWVGKEIRHFPWSKELFEAEEQLLRPAGYTIPKDWSPIVKSLEEQIKDADGDVDDEAVSQVLRDKLKLTFSGYVFKGALRLVGSYGYFWSTTESSSRGAYCLYFDGDSVGPRGSYDRSCAQSVRCVVESGSFPNS